MNIILLKTRINFLLHSLETYTIHKPKIQICYCTVQNYSKNIFHLNFQSTHASEYSVNQNMTGFNCQKNVTSSTFNERLNFRRPNFVKGFDQRSTYHRRETSPMSMIHDLKPRYRDYSYCQSEFGAQRSIISGRSGSIRSNGKLNLFLSH